MGICARWEYIWGEFLQAPNKVAIIVAFVIGFFAVIGIVILIISRRDRDDEIVSGINGLRQDIDSMKLELIAAIDRLGSRIGGGNATTENETNKGQTDKTKKEGKKKGGKTRHK